MAGKKFVVVADAVVITTGKKANGRPETSRYRNGVTLNVESEEGAPIWEQIAQLESLGAIVRATSKEHLAELKGKRLTARQAAKAAGAEDDPVAAPVDGSEPLDAPLPNTDPEAHQQSAQQPVPAAGA